ncbi:hypothetical protein WN944_026872 [Citrus x changshan-huyou]|uniref:Reverse transcriptase domain-containing protein n=1 Tax=Citrus x changshan-huyou TaxID=2935761 RepID=A0AAP0LHJ5_9ROSI
MTPQDLILAQQECAQLLKQDLIEPTNSPWSGFWQLGIHPSERYKTTFCISNAHHQWTVLPFGLKTTPSTFQKATIFQPILHHTLVCIDDLLLFSGTHDEHHKLLQQCFQIIQEHGIMISDKKSTIATTSVDFLDPTLHKSYFSFPKNPPSWSEIHSHAVKQLKQIAHNPPPLKLITDGKRILQTDASDESWGAILLEECNGKEHFIAYASGQFPDDSPSHCLSGTRFPDQGFLEKLPYGTQPYSSRPARKSSTSLGPKHEMFMIPTPSLHSQPPNRGIIIKEEKPDYTDFLFQDSQDPYEDFTPVPSPSPYELGSSSSPYPPFSSQPDQPEHYPQPVPSSPQDIPLPKGQYCPWPCVPGCSHPERILKKDKDPDRDPNETKSSYEDGTISL